MGEHGVRATIGKAQKNRKAVSLLSKSYSDERTQVKTEISICEFFKRFHGLETGRVP